MITVEIIDSLNNKKINDEKSRETVMEFIAECITQKIRKNDRRPIVLRANVGLGKSTFLLYNLWKQNPGFNIFCSQVTITNTQEIANSMSEMFLDLKMGVNLGFQTGIKKITPTQQGHIVYQTIKITTNQILKPLLFNENKGQQVNFSNSILIIDEAHSNDINMQEQLALVRQVVITNSMDTIPFIIVQSASIALKEFKEYLQASFTIQTEGLRNKVVELYLDDFQFDKQKILVGTGSYSQPIYIDDNSDSDSDRSIDQIRKNQFFESYLEAYNDREFDSDDISINDLFTSSLNHDFYDIDDYKLMMRNINSDDENDNQKILVGSGDYTQSININENSQFSNILDDEFDNQTIKNELIREQLKNRKNDKKEKQITEETQSKQQNRRNTGKMRKSRSKSYKQSNRQLLTNSKSFKQVQQKKVKKVKQVSEFVLATELIIMNIIEQSKVIQEKVKEVNCDINGNILVFICKSSQMRDLYVHLSQNNVLKTKNIQIIQLSAVLIEKDPTLIEQTRTPVQKIIIATSVVETGFTFTNLSYVIDGLKVRYVYYDPIKKCEIQRDLPIDKNMQQQRRGRVGRTQGGIYFGVCERRISDQLQEHREYQIQTTDLKQLICSIGFDNFRKMKFIGQIPVECILDVLQYQYLFGFQLIESQKSEIFNTFMTNEKFKIKPSILQNIKICEILMIVCFLEKFQSFPPTVIRNTKNIKKDRKNKQYKNKSIKNNIERFKNSQQQNNEKNTQYINQFILILNYLINSDISQLPSQYIQLYNDILLIFIQQQINVYSGISMLSENQKDQQIIRQLFFDAFKQNILIHVSQNTYKTFNGLSVIVDIESQQMPKYLVTNRIIDDLQILAQYVIECSVNDIQQVSNLWQK